MTNHFSLCVVSYQPILLEGLLSSFRSDPQVVIAGLGTSAAQAEELINVKKPNVLLLDCASEENCLACINRTRVTAPDTLIVILTGSQNVDHAVRSLEAGVRGYLTTRATGSEIVQGVRRVLNGEELVCSTLAMNVMNRIKELADACTLDIEQRLTSREQEVADLLAIGSTNREIAFSLGISERTVKYYLTGLMQKFSARNRIELVLALPRRQALLMRKTG